MNSGRPSLIRTCHSLWCISRWQTRQSMTQFSTDVSPSSSQGSTWWISHQDGGRPQRAQPRSRAATARRMPSGTTLVRRPTSSGWPRPFITIGTTPASHASIRRDSGETVPPRSSIADPGAAPYGEAAIETMRALAVGDPAAGWLLVTAAWVLGIGLIAVPMAVRGYRIAAQHG